MAKPKIAAHPMFAGKPLRRGDVVYALRRLPGIAPGIATGAMGVVFEEGDAYKDGGGPMVRFYGGQAGNVYAGDVTTCRRTADEMQAAESEVEHARIMLSMYEPRETAKVVRERRRVLRVMNQRLRKAVEQLKAVRKGAEQ